MRFTCRVLARMAMPYSVGWAKTQNGLMALIAPEGPGELLRVDPWSGESEVIGKRGGCMGVIPSQSGVDEVIAVEDFLPVYDAAHSGASVYTKGESGWVPRRLFDMPFLHRLAWIALDGTPALVAAQLCAAKSHRDDWASPGAIHLVRADEEGKWRIDPKPIIDGLHRNHGLLVRPWGNSAEMFVGADEGLIRLRPAKASSRWSCECILDIPTSDVVLCDLDGDGMEELATIHPFHGDRMQLRKWIDNRWEVVWEQQGEFGHVLWGGVLGGRSVLVTGWRGGDATLELHVLEDPVRWRFHRRVILRGVAPLNVAVFGDSHRDLLLASLGATGEVVVIEFNASGPSEVIDPR